MTSISKNVCVDKLDDKVNQYNNKYHRKIEINPVDVKSNTYINSVKKINNKDPKFKIGDIARISKFKKILQKAMFQISLKKLLLLQKLKILFPGHMLIRDLKGEEIVGTLYEKELQKTNQKEFRVEKVIKRKGDNLYVKWKCYDNSFNS